MVCFCYAFVQYKFTFTYTNNVSDLLHYKLIFTQKPVYIELEAIYLLLLEMFAKA